MGVTSESDGGTAPKEVREDGYWSYPARVGFVSGLMRDGIE